MGLVSFLLFIIFYKLFISYVIDLYVIYFYIVCIYAILCYLLNIYICDMIALLILKKFKHLMS